MGRMPVLTLAGSLLTSFALAGCQSSPPARPATQFNPPGGTLSQNKTTNTTYPVTATNNGLPSSPTTPTMSGANPPSGLSSPGSLASQPPSQFGLVNQPSRPSSTTSAGFSTPAAPTPVLSQQSPPSGLQPLPTTTSGIGSAPTMPAIPSPMPTTSNLMPTSGQVISSGPPAVGALAQPSGPTSLSNGQPPISGPVIDLPGPPAAATSMSRITGPMPAAPMAPLSSGFANPQSGPPIMPN
jgi:hypothetical protein